MFWSVPVVDAVLVVAVAVTREEPLVTQAELLGHGQGDGRRQQRVVELHERQVPHRVRVWWKPVQETLGRVCK